MKRPTELISKINYCNGEFQYLHDYIIFLENLTKTQRADTFEEIRDSMTFHQNGLSGYFTISLEEWEQLKEQK